MHVSDEMEALNQTLAVSYKRMVNQNPIAPSHEVILYGCQTPRGRRPSIDGLCHSCYEIVPWFASSLVSTADLPPILIPTGSRHIYDLNMASRDPSCPLCTFFFTVATEAATRAGLPAAPQSAMYALHVSSFSEAFFHAEDHCWFPSNGQPAVFFLSPLYTFGAKARDWALRHNSCFMLPSQGQGQGQGSEAAAPAGGRPYARELRPQADLGVVREWVRHCEKAHTHPDCNPSGLTGLNGFYVIDCEARNLVVCPGGRPYITLSYVWGTEPAESLKDSDRLPETLPRLIEDAIQVTLSLGYQFLWIDRYCIPQGDEAVKTSLIENMNRIYAESSITIIAAASEKPSDGLIGVSAPRTDLPQSLQMGNLQLSQLTTNLIDEVEKSRWNTRAWTYQEGFLSNKRLLFTKSQCYFQCGELWCTEALSIALSTVARLNRPGHAKMSQVFPWMPHSTSLKTSWVLSTMCDRKEQREAYFVDRVREYMRRELTHDADAFNAFAGVLNCLEAFSGEFLLGNVFGLPIWSRESRWSGHADARNALLRSLTWSLPCPSEKTEPVMRLNVATAKRRKGIPSWTWCGWKRSSPSSPSIEWTDEWAQEGGGECDLFPETEIAVEYDGGEIIPWTTDDNSADLLARGKVSSNARYLRVRGWISQLLIPAGCWNTGPTMCQCGPYRLERRAVRYLSNAARYRGLPLTERAYDLKIWFHSPLRFSTVEDNCCGEVMVLVSTAQGSVFERLEALCKVKMEYFISRPSVEDLVARFGWKWTEFGIR